MGYSSCTTVSNVAQPVTRATVRMVHPISMHEGWERPCRHASFPSYPSAYKQAIRRTKHNEQRSVGSFTTRKAPTLQRRGRSELGRGGAEARNGPGTGRRRWCRRTIPGRVRRKAVQRPRSRESVLRSLSLPLIDLIVHSALILLSAHTNAPHEDTVTIEVRCAWSELAEIRQVERDLLLRVGRWMGVPQLLELRLQCAPTEAASLVEVKRVDLIAEVAASPFEHLLDIGFALRFPLKVIRPRRGALPECPVSPSRCQRS